MKIASYKASTPKVMDGGPARGITARVAVGKADGALNFCMRVFEIKKDGHTPRHSHDWEHEIFFHKGKGQVLKDGKWQDVSQGDIAFVPADEEHQIRNAGEDDLVFVCLIPAGFPEI